MAFRDYLELAAFEKGRGAVADADRRKAVSQFVDFLRSANVSATTAEALTGARMFAMRGGKPIAGRRFPLLYMAQGNGQSLPDLAVLSEFLASHGYVVITTPSVMRLTGPLTLETMIGARAEEQAGDMWMAIVAAARWPNVSAAPPALVGYSFGARAALLYAMQHPAWVLVSLDGGIGTSNGLAAMKGASMFDANAKLPPILHIYEENDPRMAPDLTLLRSLKTSNLALVEMPSMRHVHFSTIGFASILYPDLAKATSAGPTIRDDLKAVAAHVLKFVHQ
jgi:dienelactone hydrolase